MLSKQTIFHFCCILFFGLIGLRALFHPGFFTSLDGWHNVARLYHYHKTLGEGQLPPRWSADLASGYGYPLFIFSYHAPWIMAEPFMLMGLDVFTVMKIVFFIGFAGSGIIFYLWLRDLPLHPIAALTAATVYLWTPYRFAKIFVGASMGEATAFLFLPLLFWGISKVDYGKRYTVIGAIGLAGMILSHMMVLPMSLFSIGLFSMYFFLIAKNKKTYIFRYSLMMLFGVGITSFYLLPLLGYSSSIQATTMKGGFTSLYVQHFVTFRQLLYSKWGFGPVIHSAKDGEISFQVGIAQWMGIALAMLLMAIRRMKKITHMHDTVLNVMIFSYVVAIFFMMDISKPIWDWVEQLFVIDFPWRFLSITTFTGAVVCGIAVHFSGKYRYGMALVIIAAALYTNRNHLNVNQYTDIPLSLYIDSERTTNTYAEYLPVWTNIDANKKPSHLVEPQEAITIADIRRDSKTVQFRVDVRSPAMLTVNYLDFPGQTVYLDDVRVDHGRNGEGKITFPVAGGAHQVRIVYEQTRLMKISNSISLASVAGLLYYSWFSGTIASTKKRR